MGHPRPRLLMPSILECPLRPESGHARTHVSQRPIFYRRQPQRLESASARLGLTTHHPYCPSPRACLVSTQGHYRELGSPPAWAVTSRMLKHLTYAQIGDRLNISSEGARAIVKRNRLPRSHDKNG